MAKNATIIDRTVAKAVRASERASREAIAQDYARRATDAARAAVEAANRAAKAAQKADPKEAAQAQRAASVACEAAKSAELVAANVTAGRQEPSAGERLARAIDASARYLVLRDGRLVAAFADEDDALLFEGELAELDRSADGATCVVRTRAGKRIAGYKVVGSRLLAF